MHTGKHLQAADGSLLAQVPRLQQRLETYLVRFEAAPALADARRVLDAHAAAIRCWAMRLQSRHTGGCNSALLAAEC